MEKDYCSMVVCSPYDNAEPLEDPNLLVMVGLPDPAETGSDP